MATVLPAGITRSSPRSTSRPGSKAKLDTTRLDAGRRCRRGGVVPRSRGRRSATDAGAVRWVPSASTPWRRSQPAREWGRSPSAKPMIRSGQTSSVKRYTKLVMSPRVAAPASTRAAPTRISSDVGVGRDGVEEQVEGGPQAGQVHLRRPQGVGPLVQSVDLTLLGAEGLDDRHRLEALVHEGRQLARDGPGPRRPGRPPLRWKTTFWMTRSGKRASASRPSTTSVASIHSAGRGQDARRCPPSTGSGPAPRWPPRRPRRRGRSAHRSDAQRYHRYGWAW